MRKKNGGNRKLRVICRYGGSIVSLPQTKLPRYVGGDTRIVAVPPSPETSFASLVSHLTSTLGISYALKIKYQLPDQELDSLISVETDEDVQIMMEEHGYPSSEFLVPQSRIRLFLFPSKPQLNESVVKKEDPAHCKAAVDIDWLGVEESKPTRRELTQPLLQHPKRETWFVDVLKSAERMQKNGRINNGDGYGAICGQESMMLETNSSFGSTSSSASSSNSPLKQSTGEENMQFKFAPIESVTSGREELPTRPHVLENKSYSNLYEAELNKPVPISGYAPFMKQAQQQHVQVIYTGQPCTPVNPPMKLPAATYHHTNNIHYQLPPQPYPNYYVPVKQYNSRHVPVNLGNLLDTYPPMVPTSSPLAPELASLVYPPPLPPQPADPSVQTSSDALSRDAFSYNSDLDDDTARALIYKTQPPGPIVTLNIKP